MTGKELAAVLTKPQYANAHVLMKVANDWVEVTGVAATGEHRNGITLQVTHPALDGGVIVVEPDLEEAPERSLGNKLSGK